MPKFEWVGHLTMFELLMYTIQTSAADLQTGIADEYVRLYAPEKMLKKRENIFLTFFWFLLIPSTLMLLCFDQTKICERKL